MTRHTQWMLALATTLGCLLAMGPGPVAAQPRADQIDPEAELVVAMPDDTQNMDPRLGMGSVRSTYIRQVFESLVDTDPQGRPVPGLALSWKPLGDTAWEFALRPGVRFHNGEPLDADTLLFNLDRMFKRNLDKWGVKDVATAGFDRTYPFVSRWEKVNDLTVRIHTTEPSPTLWDFVGREPLVPREYTIKNGVDGLNERPVGTGPWRLVEWKRQDSMRLERWDGYWGTRPQARRLRFQVIPEAAARIAALRAGQVVDDRRGAAARRQRARPGRGHPGRLESPEAPLPPVPERPAPGRLRFGRARRPLRRRPRAPGASPSPSTRTPSPGGSSTVTPR